MKKNNFIIFSTIIVAILATCNSCGLVALVLYGQMIKPTETWYFSRGFDKNLGQAMIGAQISDSCNISHRAVRLTRKDNDTIKCYWVDMDTTYCHDNGIRLKIVDSNGIILRYLDAWLVPGSKNGIDYSSTAIISDKKGNLLIKTDSAEHRIFHAGDIMGLHHFDFQKPSHIGKATLQYNWNGYAYRYKWTTYEGKRDDFHLIYEYSYEGELADSFYVTINCPYFSLSDNHFIKWNDWDYDNKNYILNNGKNYKLSIEINPFGGFGEDVNKGYLNPLLHSFDTNGYIGNCLKAINSEYPAISSFDFVRNEKTLKIVNETIKAIGYSKFVSKNEYYAKKYGIDKYGSFHNSNFGYSLCDIRDSLVFYYKNPSAPTYYKEFWARRESEKIAEYVYSILTDIQQHYSNRGFQIDSGKVNDTLKTLLTFDLRLQNENFQNRDKTIIEYYNFLTKVGMAQSAYNLIFIDDVSSNTEIDKEMICSNLKINKQPYIIDNKTYYLTRNKPRWID